MEPGCVLQPLSDDYFPAVSNIEALLRKPAEDEYALPPKESRALFLLSRDGNGSRTEAGEEPEEGKRLGLRFVELRDFVNLCG